MNLDDQLRSAADDARSGLGSEPPPPFEPRSSGGSRLALVAAVAAFVAGSLWLAAPDNDPVPVDVAVADDADELATAPDETAETSETSTPAGSSGVTGFELLATSGMEVPNADDFTIDPDTDVPVRLLERAAEGSALQPVFSRTQTHTADGSLILLYRTRDETAMTSHVIVDATTGAIVAEPNLSGADDIENISWDGVDPNLLTFTADGELIVLDVQTGEIVARATGTCGDGSSLDTGDTAGSTTSGTSSFGLLCRQADGTALWAAYDTTTDTMTLGTEATINEAPLPMISGNGYVVVGNTEVLILDTQLAVTNSVAIEASAATVAQDSDGSDVLVTTVFGGPTDVGTAVVVDLDSGAVRVVVGPTTGAPFPPSGTQLSTAATDRPNLVAISTFSNNTGPLVNEVMLLELDGDNSELRRLAHHRSMDNRADDWPTTPMVAISPDGTRVLFSSNWGSNTIATYELALPS